MHRKTIKKYTQLNPHTVNWNVYRKRINAWIDETLDMMFWLAKNNPDIFLNPEKYGNDRLKKLLLIIKASMKNGIDVELVKSVENQNDKRN